MDARMEQAYLDMTEQPYTALSFAATHDRVVDRRDVERPKAPQQIFDSIKRAADRREYPAVAALLERPEAPTNAPRLPKFHPTAPALALGAGSAVAGGMLPRGRFFDRPDDHMGGARGTPPDPSKGRGEVDDDGESAAAAAVAEILGETPGGKSKKGKGKGKKEGKGAKDDAGRSRRSKREEEPEEEEDDGEDEEPRRSKGAKGKDKGKGGKGGKDSAQRRRAEEPEEEPDDEEDEDGEGEADDDDEQDRRRTKPGADYSREADDEDDDEDEDEEDDELEDLDVDHDALAKRFRKIRRETPAEERRPRSDENASGDDDGEEEDGAAPEQSGSAKDQPRRGGFTPLLSKAEREELNTHFADTNLPKLLDSIEKRIQERDTKLVAVMRYLTGNAQERVREAQHQTKRFFVDKCKEGFAEEYGKHSGDLDDAQDEMRNRVIRRAVAVQREVAAEGGYLSFTDALEVAHRALNMKRIERLARESGRREIEEATKTRHRRRDLTPTAAGGFAGPDALADDDDGMRSATRAVSRKLRTLGLDPGR